MASPGITTTFVLRCLFSPFAHPLFTAFTGIGVGLAVTSRRPLVRWFAPLLGYLVAVLAHGLWNGSTIYGAEGFIGTYVLIMVPAFTGLVLLAVWARRRSAGCSPRPSATPPSAGSCPPPTSAGWST